MRLFLAAAIALNPTFGLAAEFTTQSNVVVAKLFPNGASVTREAAVDLPLGTHRIILHDIPRNLTAGTLQVGVEAGSGVSVTAMNVRTQRSIPVPAVKTDQMVEAEQALTRAEAARNILRQERAQAQGDLDSAHLRIEYLKSLASGGEGHEALPADLVATIGVIGAHMAQATQDRTAARAALAATARRLQELEAGVVRAKQALEAATPLARETATLFVELQADQPYQGVLQLGYLDRNASWSPRYELHLDQAGDAGRLEMIRQAVVRQGTGEDWAEVALTLSTADLGRATQVFIPNEMIFWLEDKGEAKLLSRTLGDARRLNLAEPAMEEAAQMTADGFAPTAQTALRGQTLEFNLSAPVSVDGDWGEKLLRLDQIGRDVGLFALANARRDANAYLYTDLKNDIGGQLLSGPGAIYRDGVLVGQTTVPQTPSGDIARLGLGSLNGIQLDHRILSTQAGDTGFVRASDTKTEKFELQIDSRLDYVIDLTVYEALPVSEDEDLQVRLTTVPAPSEEAVEGRRGVIGWSVPLAAGASRTISYGWTLRWPEDQDLRQHYVPF